MAAVAWRSERVVALGLRAWCGGGVCKGSAGRLDLERMRAVWLRAQDDRQRVSTEGSCRLGKEKCGPHESVGFGINRMFHYCDQTHWCDNLTLLCVSLITAKTHQRGFRGDLTRLLLMTGRHAESDRCE